MQQVYFLDRNAMIKIRNYLKKRTLSSRDKKIINALQKLDRNENIVSPYLSIVEGKRSADESIIDKIEVIEEECDLITTFYQQATVDKNLLLEMTSNLCETMQGSQEPNFILSKLFLKKISPLPEVPKKNKKKRKEIEKKVLDTAKEIGLPYTHITVLATLAALYGSKEMRNLLHLTKKNNEKTSYNAASDVYAFMRVCAFEALAKIFGKEFQPQIITFDSNLNVLLDALSHSSGRISHLPNEQVLHNIEGTVDHSLFPYLTPQEHYDYITELVQKEEKRIQVPYTPVFHIPIGSITR